MTCAGWVFLLIVSGNATIVGPFQTQQACAIEEQRISESTQAAIQASNLAPYAYVGECAPTPGKDCR